MLNQMINDEDYTPEGLQLYRELMIEANTQLGYVQLPEEIFGNYKELMKVTAYDAMKQVLGEDPRKHYKREIINRENQSMRMVYTQLQDGSVPSFEEFKSIKDKIANNNAGMYAKQSPLRMQEEQQKSVQQYQYLEKLIQSNSKSADRAKRIQD